MNKQQQTTFAVVLQTISLAALIAFAHTAAFAASAPTAVPLGQISAGLQAPSDIAFDPEGNVYVTDARRGEVAIYDAFGRLAFTHKGFEEPLAIAIDSARIYIAEAKARRVSVFSRSFQLLGAVGSGDGEFVVPVDIALDGRSRRIFVCDSGASEVRVFSGTSPLTSFGTHGSSPGQLDHPSGVHVSPAQEVLVVDRGNGRVQVFTEGGVFVRGFSLDVPASQSGYGSSKSSRCQGIAGDGNGRVYVADSFQGFVSVFDTQGNFLSTLGSFGQGSGQFRSPVAVGINPNNCLFVASANNAQVDIVGLDNFLGLSASPESQLAAAGSPANFTVAVTGAGSFTYQWLKGGVPLTDGPTLTGSSGATLRCNSLTLSDSGSYAVQVTSASGTVVSRPALLTVLAPPTILAQPTSQTAIKGQSVTVSISTAGDSLAYQWQLNGVDIAGANSARLQIDSADLKDAGTYSVLISNPVGAITSEPAQLTVIEPPRFPEIDSAQIMPDNSVDLAFRADAGRTYTIETSADLNSWSILATIFSENGAMEFLDTDAANFTCRFYRIHWVP